MMGRGIPEVLVLLAMFYLIIWNTGIHLLFLVLFISEAFHKMFTKSKDEMNRVELRVNLIQRELLREFIWDRIAS